jgi:hypothetical protein
MKAEQIDLMHLGYAMAYEIPLFLIKDRNLTYYRILLMLIEKGINKIGWWI